MKKFLLLFILITVSILPQVLKEFEVQPTTNRGQIPIFRDFPDKAAIIFYTKFSNLTFSSSFGIYKQLGDPEGGKYIIVVEPTRQTIEVRGPGYKTEQIKIGDLQPRDVLYYEVLPKKEEGISGISELAVTILVQPADASIKVDGNSVKNDTPVQLTIGDHTLVVEKPGFNAFSGSITVGPNSTFFRVNLTANDPVPLVIESNPPGADIFIDGINKGKTPKSTFLYPGSYELKLLLSAFHPVQEKITVTKNESQNRFIYKLEKNAGNLKIEVTPTYATVRINKDVINAAVTQELAPGIYQIEVEAPSHNSFSTTVQIETGKTATQKIVLVERTGRLQFAITPSDAECVLTSNGIERYRWRGIKVFSSIGDGIYDLTATAAGYKTYSSRVVITEGQSTLLEVQMEQETVPMTSRENATNTIPEGLVLVEGGTFTMGSADGGSDEMPTHQVTVSSFFMGKYEVTQALWESVMGKNPSYLKGSNRPVESVTWYEAVEFCNKLSEKEGLLKAYSESGGNILCDFTANGYRLPTEAEREYAARGGNKSRGYEYSGSNDLDEVGWYRENSRRETKEVGKKQPNELGLYDMSGNVREWCWDLKKDYSSSSQTDPRGPKSGSSRVLRDGSWGDDAEYCRVAGRTSYGPGFGSADNGFRLARTR